MKENSPINTVVGSLTTSDPDNLHKARQTFSYRIVDSANGRFKVDGDVVKVLHPADSFFIFVSISLVICCYLG